MSFKKSFFKNVLTLGGYNYGSQIATFLSSIVLSRLLLPSEYGYVALITVFTGFITIFADAGLSFSIIRNDYGRTFQRAIGNLSFYIGLILFLVMAALAYPIALFYEDMTLVVPTIVISSLYVIGSFKIAPMGVLLKRLDFAYIGKVRFISNLSLITFMIILAWLGFSIWALLIPQLLVQIVKFVLFERKVKLGFKFYKFSYTIVAFRKTKKLFLNLSSFSLINYWASNADNLIIGKFYSSYELGIYNRAYRMLVLTKSLISGLFSTILYPSLKKYRSEGGDFKPEYDSILGVISLINFPIIAILILIPDFMVRVLWGENWLLVAGFLPYFGIVILFQTLLTTTGQIYILLEKEKTYMILGVVSGILRVVAIAIGSTYSTLGIAIGLVISNFAVDLPLQLYVGFYRTFGFSFKNIAKFWLPKIALAGSIFIMVLLGNQIWLMGLLFAYLCHLIYFQRNDLNKIPNLIKNYNNNRKLKK